MQKLEYENYNYYAILHWSVCNNNQIVYTHSSNSNDNNIVLIILNNYIFFLFITKYLDDLSLCHTVFMCLIH